MNTRASSFGTAERNETEDQFTYYANVASLEQIASYKISTKIWLSYVSRFEPNDFETEPHDSSGDLCNLAFGLDFKYWHDTGAWARALGLPQSIEKRIVECNDEVVDQTRQWILHFRFQIMRSEMLIPYLVHHFDPQWCVWSPEGKIDYAKTAAKMVASPGWSKTNASGLTNEQKFAIMSSYCMEDEIKTFPPLPENFMQAVSFNEDPLIFYWNCYRRNVLHNVPLGNHDSIDFVMALKCCNQTWTAFEYFWNRLNAEDQVIAAENWLRITAVGQERLLSKMSWSQQLRLLRKIPEFIIENFCVNLPQSALWAWKHTRGVLTASQFAGIVHFVFMFPSNEEIMRSLVEMWDTAPNHIQKYFAENEDYAMAERIACEIEYGTSILRFLSPKTYKVRKDFILRNSIISPERFYASYKSKNCKEFVFRFLSTKTVNSRKDFIFKNAFQFAIRMKDLEFMKDLIETCLPDSKHQLELQKLIMESDEVEDHYAGLLHRGEFNDLRSKIEFYSSNDDSEREFKQRVLNAYLNLYPDLLSQFVAEFKKWTELSNFIDEAFPDDEPSASSIKKRLVLSYVNNLGDDWKWNSCMNGVMRVVESTFRDEELKSTKLLFSKCFKNLWTSMEGEWRSHKEEFHKFVSWCFSNDDEKAILEFKRAAPVDKIFDDVIEELHSVYVRQNSFSEHFLPDLNDFLMWIFSDVEKANKYKLDRIGSLEESQIFTALRERNDEPNLEMLTKWYFDDDEAEIRKFRSKKLKAK